MIELNILDRFSKELLDKNFHELDSQTKAELKGFIYYVGEEFLDGPYFSTLHSEYDDYVSK